jgi:uncharacterized protein (TIGR00369 family)
VEHQAESLVSIIRQEKYLMENARLETLTFENGMSFKWSDFIKGSFIEHNGIYLTDIGKGHIQGELSIRREFLNPTGILHGGVIVTLADTIAIIGCGYLYEALNITTVNMNVSFIKPVISGKVIAKSKVISQGKHLSLWQVDVFNEKDELLAVVSITFSIKK